MTTLNYQTEKPKGRSLMRLVKSTGKRSLVIAKWVLSWFWQSDPEPVHTPAHHERVAHEQERDTLVNKLALNMNAFL